MKSNIKSYLVLTLATMALAGCNYTVKKSPGDGSGGGSANKAIQIDFQMVKTQVLAAKCISCHEHTDMVDYSVVMEDVTPGRPADSLLWTKLMNNGGDMPKGGPPLSESEADLIKQWILNGAPEFLDNSSSGEAPTPTPAPTPVPPPADGPIDFALVKAQVLEPKCISCHHHSDMKDYAAVMDDVVPGNLAKSDLWTNLINNGGEMPLHGAALPDADVQLIKQWILNGAPETVAGVPPTGPGPGSGPGSGPQPAPAPGQPTPVQPAPAPGQPVPGQPAPAPGQPGTTPPPPGEFVNPTFSDLESKVFAKKCLMCHSESTKAAGVALEKYDDLINNVRLLVPGSSEKSGLYIAVAKDTPPYMPPARAVAKGVVQVLTDDEKAALKAWIDAGAVRN